MLAAVRRAPGVPGRRREQRRGYDTIYVDLDDDYQFGDEKPVTKGSPVSYRDMNGDGYIDLSGGLALLHLRRPDSIPGGIDEFGDDDDPAAGAMVAWTGDFDPGIEGHGTLTASNVVGQGVINGKAPTFTDMPGRHATRGRARRRAEGEARPDGRHLLRVRRPRRRSATCSPTELRRRRDVELVRPLGRATTTASTPRARRRTSSTRRTARRRRSSRPATARRATARRPRRRRSLGISVGASTQFGGDRLGLDRERISQIIDNDVDRVVEPRPGATAGSGRRRRRRRRLRAGDATLNTVAGRPERVGDVGRHEPLDAGRRRRDRARLPGVRARRTAAFDAERGDGQDAR